MVCCPVTSAGPGLVWSSGPSLRAGMAACSLEGAVRPVRGLPNWVSGDSCGVRGGRPRAFKPGQLQAGSGSSRASAHVQLASQRMYCSASRGQVWLEGGPLPGRGRSRRARPPCEYDRSSWALMRPTCANGAVVGASYAGDAMRMIRKARHGLGANEDQRQA